MKLSIIIPVFNGAKTLKPLFEDIKVACEKNQYNFEVIFVWDCGPDNSWEKISELKKEFPLLVKAIRLSRNFGQHNALICGFSFAEGDFVITMDEDLQHNPKDIKLLIEKQMKGDFDVVYGDYSVRQHSGFRNLTSRILKKMLSFGIPELHKDYSAFRLIRSEIAQATVDMQNSYTFLDGYLSWITNSVSSVKVSHNTRLGGKSSYTLKKLIRHSINIFVTFSDLPIKLVTTLSMLFFVFTSAYAIYIALQKLLFNSLVPGFASMMVLLGFGIGSILFGISVIGQYIHRINHKTTRRPNYRVAEVL